MKTPIILLLLFVNLCILSLQTSYASSASFYYSDGPWSGKVIDAETKQPIEGAVVVAVWKKVYPFPTGNYSRFLDAIEVLTDKNGKFFIQKFKAYNIFPLAWMEGPNLFTIYKPGYTAFPGTGNEYFRYFPNSSLRVDNDTLEGLLKRGITVELLKLKTAEERIKNIPGDPFANIRSKKLPLLYKLKNEERKQFGFEEIQ